jgi:hypothetical protein
MFRTITRFMALLLALGAPPLCCAQSNAQFSAQTFTASVVRAALEEMKGVAQ